MTSWFEPAEGSREPLAFVPDPVAAAPFRTADEARAASTAIPDEEPTPRSDRAAEQFEAAVRAAFEQGRSAEIAEARLALGAPATALAAATAALCEQRTHYLQAQRRLLLDLALEIAGRLVEREISADRGVLEAMLARALDLFEDSVPILIELSPGDLAALSGANPPALARLLAGRDARLQAREDLAPGDARVVSGATRVDAQLAPMLQRIREEIAGCETADALPEVSRQ